MNDHTLISHKDDRFQLKVKVITGSAATRLAGIKNNELVIKLNAQPEKGKANNALVGFFSKILHIAKTEINITSGNQSRHKIISLPSSCYAALISLLER